ncbi:MAG TPA: hypothetical protein DD632_03705 [Oribacterium sp.]|nr:hypothetical protein [Oribacterium sp.]
MCTYKNAAFPLRDLIKKLAAIVIGSIVAVIISGPIIQFVNVKAKQVFGIWRQRNRQLPIYRYSYSFICSCYSASAYS